ncbi:MAG: hypothetical protein L6R36_008560 [Xanthoria steineri]|nr:MAG: hypothetical protein L6R36_008560 [Xanthoria steineri]
MGYCSDLAANERRDNLPESSNGSVLITSRSREAAFELVGEDKNILKVEPMSEGYALALFRKKLEGEDHEDEVLELLRNLDYMPLAISQNLVRVYPESNNIMNFEEDIKVLRNYSLVALGIENDVFEIHRLVQFATRKWLEQRQEMERWKETYIAIIADAFPLGRYENWKRCRMLFPHAVLVLEYQPIKKSFLRRWTAVLSNAAWYAAEQGRYDEAEQMNRRALDGYEKVLGKEHSDTLTSVSNLALVLRHQSKYDEAEQMNRRALDGGEKVLGKEHPSTLTSVYCLAYLLHQQ